MSASKHLSDQFDNEDDGPYCANCSDDIEEVMEWHSSDRERIRPENRIPCKGCGAI